MKILSIGREDTCDIVIDDPESLISRKHAMLRLHYTGKMEIVDMSANGTYVNGRPIAKNVPFPVSRKDVVSFARVKKLDWKQVPNYKLYIQLGAAALILLAIIIAAIHFCSKLDRTTCPTTPQQETTAPLPNDQNDKENERGKEENKDKKEEGGEEADNKMTAEQAKDAFKKYNREKNRENNREKNREKNSKDNKKDKKNEKDKGKESSGEDSSSNKNKAEDKAEGNEFIMN